MIIQNEKTTFYNRFLYCLYIFIICIISSFSLTAQDNMGMVDIKDAITIISSAMGIKIVVEGDIKGQLPLELDNVSPRQIRDRLEKALLEQGYYWVSEGGVVRITRTNKKQGLSAFGRELPLSYYINIISRNNLFRPLWTGRIETKSEFILRGLLGAGDSVKAIIEESVSGKSYYVSVGDNIGSYRIVNITSEKVTISGSKGNITLNIKSK